MVSFALYSASPGDLGSQSRSKLSFSACSLGCWVGSVSRKKGVRKEDLWQVLRLWTLGRECLLKSATANTKKASDVKFPWFLGAGEDDRRTWIKSSAVGRSNVVLGPSLPLLSDLDKFPPISGPQPAHL